MNKSKKLKAAEKKEYYTLSPAQERLYLIRQFDPASTAYNLVKTIPQFDADLSKVEKSINCLVEKFPVFRTTFHQVDHKPVQVIQKEGYIKINRVYMNNPGEEDMYRALVKPFDLEQFPLVRITAVFSDHHQHPLLFVEFHHILFDATSIYLFFKMVNDIYNGKPVQVPAFQYHDYSEWFARSIPQQEKEKQKVFWKSKFAGAIPILDLPADFHRKPVKSSNGSSLTFYIDKNTTAAIRALAEAFETTVFNVLLCMYKILLHRLAAQEDIVAGIPVSGRNNAALENMFGMFVNVVPVRSFPTGEMSVVNYLQQVKDETRQSLANQDFQLGEIVKHVNVLRDNARSPLFDVLFDMLNHVKEREEENSIDTGVLLQKPVAAQYDLVVKALEKKDNIMFLFEYCSDLFTSETITRYIEYFKNIIKSVTGNPLQPLAAIEIITSEEKNRIVQEFNDTATSYPKHKTIHALFEETALRKGDAPAIIFKEETLSYRRLHESSDRLARAIRHLGIADQEIIGIMQPRSHEMIISILAILKAGCAYLPIDPDYPFERIKYVIEDSNLKLLLTDPSFAGINSRLNHEIKIIDVTSATWQHMETEPVTGNVPSSSLAYLIYTSGSTGNPKGVMIEHRNVINLVQGISDKIKYTAGSTILCLTTISFDIFVTETILPLLKGMKIILASAGDQKDPHALAKLIKEQRVDILQVTPSHLKLLLSVNNFLSGLKILMVGGEAFPSELLQEVKKQFNGEIYNMYGPTETTVWSTTSNLTNASSISIGKPIANTIMRILDNRNRIQPIGVAGELCIGGEGVARGYWKKEKLTKEKFVTDPVNANERIYRTGDLAKWRADGTIEFLGRIDNQVKIRGFRIEPGEIESRLSEHELINDVVVVAKGKETEKYLVAYYTAEEEIGITGLRSHLLYKLPDYMVPSYFIHLNSLPITPNGKLDKKALPDPAISTASAVIIPPANKTEQKLVEIWAEILDLEKDQISVDANFFELGGHSLKIIKMNKMVNDHFVCNISAGTIFRLPHIQAIAEFIEAKKGNAGNEAAGAWDERTAIFETQK